MARRKAILQSTFPYSVSARCINREWFKVPMETVWTIMSDELFLTHHYFKLQIHLFLLMNNHFHLVATTPEANISSAMNYFMSRTSSRLTESGNRINQTYAGRHYKCILNSPTYFLNTYKYVYRNPVEAGMCKYAVDYPYSTLSGIVGSRSTIIPLVEDTTFFSDPVGTLKWLNSAPSQQKLEAMRWALKRQYFKSPRKSSNGKPILGENDLL